MITDYIYIYKHIKSTYNDNLKSTLRKSTYNDSKQRAKIAKSYKETLGDENILYLHVSSDFTNVYTCQNASNCMLWLGVSFPFNLSFGTKAMFSFYRAPWLKMLLFIISFFYLFYLYLFNIRSCIFLRAELYFIPRKLCKRYFQIAQVLALWFWRIQIYSYSK